jgi:hypothetical protein
MGEHRLQSLIIAADNRSLLKEREANLAKVDAHHEVVPTTMCGSPSPVGQVMQSPAVLDSVDISGVDEILANFFGMAVEVQVA